MGLTVLYLAVPTLGAELQLRIFQHLWITDIYGFQSSNVTREGASR